MFLCPDIYLLIYYNQKDLVPTTAQETYFGSYLLPLPHFVVVAAVCYKHYFFYSHYTLSVTFFKPLGIGLTVEIYRGLIS